jgi:peptide/nickel transport system ATP-binding protein
MRSESDPRSPVLDVSGLRISVPGPGGGSRVEAVHGASFRIDRGEAVGLVGESGSGKTLTCRAVLGVLPSRVEVTGGSIEFGGRDVAHLDRRGWAEIRGRRVGAVFQEPASFLNPSLSVGSQLAEVLRVRGGLERRPARRRAVELLELMGIHHADHVFHQIPAELSGGMLQRVMIASALLTDPKLILADEPTTALDVTTQAEVMALIQDLRRRTGIAVLMVSHDLTVVAELCDRIVVFYAGEVVESGPVEQIVNDPRHPYTQALLRVASLGDHDGHRTLEVIAGQPPGVGADLPGCRFADRCPHARDECVVAPVALRPLESDRTARCIRVDELVLGGAVR